MIALIGLLAVVAVSALIVRIGTVSLAMTGLSRDVAAFQAQSAFSGVGFTTAESEAIVGHPVRRRICRMLMLMGTAGVTSVVATLIVTFTQKSDQDLTVRLLGVALGLLALYALSRSPIFNAVLNWLIRKALKAWTKLEIRDYEQILQVAKGYSISQIIVEPNDWLANRTLRRLHLRREGVVVLSVTRRDGMMLGAPTLDTLIVGGDTLICYGQEENLTRLSERKRGATGDVEHTQMTVRFQLSRTAESTLDKTSTSAVSSPLREKVDGDEGDGNAEE